jgi:hypothetical protein
MKPNARREQVGVSLFPFLAVLICTMGALIVLLVLLVQQASVDASTIAVGNIGGGDDAQQRQLRERLEEAQWRRELLERSRTEKVDELAQSRARLAHLEEHAQRLAARARELLEQARSIDEGKRLRDGDLAAARAEIARLKAEIDRKQRELDEAAKRATGKESYALIPYNGPSGTRRRPIYIECTEFGVIIQPEGLLLKADDFSGPLGPGNPLDMALRAIREHIERTAGDSAGQPYPLLVVRPGGIVAYAAARSSMRAWDDEFGYELIGDDKQLDFGQPDPALAATLNKTVAAARHRQTAMIAMMPRHFQGEEPLKSFAPDASADSSLQRTAGSGGVGSGTGRGVGGPGSATRSASAGGRPDSGVGADGLGSGGRGSALSAGFGGSGDGSTRQASGGGSGTPGTGPMLSPANAPSTTGTGNQPATSGGAYGGNSASPGSPTAAQGSTGAPSAQFGDSGQTSGGAAGGGSSSSLGGQMGGGQMGTPSPSINLDFGGPKKSSANGGTTSGFSSKTSSRTTGSGSGTNWALQGVKPHQIGVTRPIRVSVLPDRLVLVPDRGDDRPPQIVKVAPELTSDDIDHFVAAVQSEVKGWGLAVADGYWKPVLHAEVAPGAERHFLNLQTALRGSGIDVMRR